MSEVTVTTRLTLVRHGESVWHADNRYAGGGSDIDLTPRGRSQAQALAAWAEQAKPMAVVASSVRRAVETAAPAAARIGVRLRISDDLREVDFGVAEGRTIDELLDLDADMVHRFRDDPVAHPFPGSEQPDAAADRASAALRRIAAQSPGGHVLVVAHNTLLRLALCRLLGLPVAGYRQLFPRLDNGALTQIELPSVPDTPDTPDAADQPGVALRSLNVPLLPIAPPEEIR